MTPESKPRSTHAFHLFLYLAARCQGRITEKIETVQGRSNRWTYAYDNKGRLFEARLDNRLICQCYYDKQGRRIQDSFPATHGVSTRTFRYTMNNRLQAAGNNGYTHDRQGMRILWNHGGNYTRYEYASDHRLLRATREWDGTVFEFAHHDTGQRAAKFPKRHAGRGLPLARLLIRMAAFYDGTHEFVFTYRKDQRTPYAMQRDDGQTFTLHYGPSRLPARGCRPARQRDTGNPVRPIWRDHRVHQSGPAHPAGLRGRPARPGSRLRPLRVAGL